MSILGTLGPLVQGPSEDRREKTKIVAAFSVAFLAGATAVFAAAGAAGAALGAADLPFGWRLGLAGAGLLGLAAVDVLAMRRGTYCPLGWRRQTPRTLLRRYRVVVVALVWGCDTGLAVTTFRVAAVTWGAILLAGLGLVPRWVGLAYGLGFVAPFFYLLYRHRVGRCATRQAPSDPGLESMLARRAVLQSLSAAMLITGAGVLIGTLVA